GSGGGEPAAPRNRRSPGRLAAIRRHLSRAVLQLQCRLPRAGSGTDAVAAPGARPGAGHVPPDGALRDLGAAGTRLTPARQLYVVLSRAPVTGLTRPTGEVGAISAVLRQHFRAAHPTAISPRARSR